MISSQEYIDSGILELYVYGKLTEAEVAEVQKMALQHEEINQEIIAIEQALVLLTNSIAPPLSVKNYQAIKSNLFLLKQTATKIQPIVKPDVVENPRFKLFAYMGWIIATLILVLYYYYYDSSKKESLQKEQVFKVEKSNLNDKLIELKTLNNEAEHLITVFRDTSNLVVPLQGQDAAPKAFAKIYWNKKNKTVYIDALGLPSPPFGMVYQVWAFKLNPLTPTNLGIMDTYQKEGRKFFKVNPIGEIDAFGISLEPEGGNETPTLEQLFALGKV